MYVGGAVLKLKDFHKTHMKTKQTKTKQNKNARQWGITHTQQTSF